jgi:uncharacterized membrane protein YhhN
MVLHAFAAGNFINNSTAKSFIAGAVFFIISDSLLALDKFYRPFALASVLIMLTYGIAQWLIVKAAIRNNVIMR